MRPEPREEWLRDHRSPLDGDDQDFDWQRLYRLLDDAETDEGSRNMLEEMFIRFIQMLMPGGSRRIQPEGLGLRLIALAWVLSPSYFEGSPSLKRLAKRCGVRPAALAVYTGHFSRLLQWRNRGQQHAWNWSGRKTPKHRGKVERKLKRNVPRSEKGPKRGPQR